MTEEPPLARNLLTILADGRKGSVDPRKGAQFRHAVTTCKRVRLYVVRIPGKAIFAKHDLRSGGQQATSAKRHDGAGSFWTP